jgi:uncharacterized membrane protein
MHWKDFSDAALFGLIDGLNGAVGLIIGLLHVHAAAALIFTAILARAGASCVSMAGAQFESSDDSARKVRYTRVAAMGLGYLTSALLPGLGFAFNVHLGVLVFIPVSVVILAVITWTRAKRAGWLKAAITTLVIFVLAVAAGLLAGLVG